MTSARMLSSRERTSEQAYQWDRWVSACYSECRCQQQPIQLHSSQRRLNGAHPHRSSKRGNGSSSREKSFSCAVLTSARAVSLRMH